MGEVMFWILWSIMMFDSQMSECWTSWIQITYLSCFASWIVKAREIIDPVEKFTDWERFQSLASALVSPRIEINSCTEADKAARDFAASVASA
jgi:hypothetical protein